MIATLLEKAAIDNGFDVAKGADGAWLRFASSQTPLQIALAASDGGLVLAVSQVGVAKALGDHGEPFAGAVPAGSVGALRLADLPALGRAVRRAFQLSRSLPDEPLTAFHKATASMPKTTEADRLVVQRVGQDIFRKSLLDYWDGRCAVTGLAVPDLLRASHIKPWAQCASDAERLDVFNGLLLAPHLDAAFDRGFISFADEGAIVVSPSLSSAARKVLGIHADLRLVRVEDAHRAYLGFHRRHELSRDALDLEITS